MKKPRLCYITHHCCTRVLKEALALLKKGYEIHLVTAMNPIECRWFQSVHLHSTQMQLQNVLRQLEDAKAIDIYHVHNEPTRLIYLTRQAIGKKPLIFDAHDWELLRCATQKIESVQPFKLKAVMQEARATELADGIVYISDPIQAYMNKRYNVTKPNIVIQSWCNEEFQNTPEVIPKQGTVVYEGGTDSKELGEEWRNYVPVAEAFAKEKIDFHIYGFYQNDKDRKRYEDTGATLHCPVPRNILVRELAKYQWGVFGTLDKSKNMKWCLPNKLFEYTMAGIPTITVKYCDETAKFVKKHGIGVVLDEFNGAKLPDPREFKENIWKLRPEITMEKQIPKLEELYQQFMS